MESIASRAKSITSSTTAGNRTRVTISDVANSGVGSFGDHYQEASKRSAQTSPSRRDPSRPFTTAQSRKWEKEIAPSPSDRFQDFGAPQPIAYGPDIARGTPLAPSSFTPLSIPATNPFSLPPRPPPIGYSYPPYQPPYPPRQPELAPQSVISRDYAEPARRVSRTLSASAPLPPVPERSSRGSAYARPRTESSYPENTSGQTQRQSRHSGSTNQPDPLVRRPARRAVYNTPIRPQAPSEPAPLPSSSKAERTGSSRPIALIEYRPHLGEPREIKSSAQPPKVYYETETESGSDSEPRGRARTFRKSSAKRDRPPRRQNPSDTHILSNSGLSTRRSSSGARTSSSDSSWELTASSVRPGSSASHQKATRATETRYVLYDNPLNHPDAGGPSSRHVPAQSAGQHRAQVSLGSIGPLSSVEDFYNVQDSQRYRRDPYGMRPQSSPFDKNRRRHDEYVRFHSDYAGAYQNQPSTLPRRPTKVRRDPGRSSRNGVRINSSQRSSSLYSSGSDDYAVPWGGNLRADNDLHEPEFSNRGYGEPGRNPFAAPGPSEYGTGGFLNSTDYPHYYGSNSHPYYYGPNSDPYWYNSGGRLPYASSPYASGHLPHEGVRSGVRPEPFSRQPAGNPFEPLRGLLDENMRHAAFDFLKTPNAFDRQAPGNPFSTNHAGSDIDLPGNPFAFRASGPAPPKPSEIVNSHSVLGSLSSSTSSDGQPEQIVDHTGRQPSPRETPSKALESKMEGAPERHVRWVPSQSDLDFDDGDDMLEGFDVELFSTRKAESLESDVTPENEEFLDARAVPFLGPWNQHNIKRSLWIGNSLDGRELTAEITLFATSPTPSKSMFTWLHLTREVMNFEEFMAFAFQRAKLAKGDVDNIQDFLRKIHLENQKPMQYGCDMESTCVSEFDYEDVGPQRKTLSSIVFYSIPVISLEKYNGAALRHLPQGSPLHPARGIVQAFTRVSSDKRELNQAVTTRSSALRGHCLHTASMWCLVINEHVLITCSRLNLEQLRGDVVKMIQPPYDTEPNDVRIMAGASCGWQIPTESVHAWPNLLAFFGDRLSDTGANRCGFRHEGKPVSSSSWPAIIQRSTIQHVDLMKIAGTQNEGTVPVGTFAMAKSVVEQSYPDCAGLRTVAEPDMKGTASGPIDVKEVDPPGHFHLHNQSGSRGASTLGVFAHANHSQGRTIKEVAEIMHATLSSQGTKEQRKAYHKCRIAKVKDISEWLDKTNVKDGRPSEGQSRDLRNRRRDAQHIAILVIYICAFFWPPGCTEVVVEKLFGSVLEFLIVIEGSSVTQESNEGSGAIGSARRSIPARPRPLDQMSELLAILRDEILPHVHGLTGIFADSEHCLQDLPSELFKAWLRLVTSLIQVAQIFSANEGQSALSSNLQPRAFSTAIHQLKLMSEDMKNGELELTTKLREKTSLAHEICTTRGIAVLIADRLCKGVMGSSPEVVQIYDDYFQQMQSIVRQDRFQRMHQDTISDFKQELDAVLAVMQNQIKVLELLRVGNSNLSKDDKFPDMLAFRGGRPLDRKMREALKRAEYRIDALRSLYRRAVKLEAWHISQIETNKDKQEAAIIVFTMVTTIFLPLSFVASVLGMNTNDIRNMDSDQWVFWAVAIPLTVLVMITSLWSAGLIDQPRSWIAALIQPPKNKRSAALPDGPGKLDRVSSRKVEHRNSAGISRRHSSYLAVQPQSTTRNETLSPVAIRHGLSL